MHTTPMHSAREIERFSLPASTGQTLSLERRFDPLRVDGDLDDTVKALLGTVQALGTGALVPPDSED